MKETLSGKNKIQQICDLLKKETLEPAHQEAEEIVENARMQAAEIIDKAKSEADDTLKKAEQDIEKKRQAYTASLSMATRQSIEALKQQIEKQLFQETLSRLIAEQKVSLDLLSNLIEVIIQAIKEEGIDSELSVYIGKNIDISSLNKQVSKTVLDALAEKEVILGGFANGITIKIHKDNITLDLSDKTLTELMVQFVRKDFRSFFFKNN